MPADLDALIAEAEGLCAAATPGPWSLCHHLRPGGDDSCPCGYRGGIWSGDGETIVLEMGGSPEVDGTKILPEADRPQQIADAAFIARARTLLPELLAALRQRPEREEIESKLIEFWADGHAAGKAAATQSHDEHVDTLFARDDLIDALLSQLGYGAGDGR